jgi:CopG antitoxin of type II toxin-antitoxin system
MTMKKSKIPKFKSIAEEAAFWDTHSFADHWDEFEPIDVMVELSKPKEETLVLRVNKDVKKQLEQKAKDKGITISTLARILLTEKLRTI